MKSVNEAIEVSASADDVWKQVGSFANADWVPGTRSCEVDGHGVGSVRTITTVDGATIRERLLSLDGNERSYSYTIVEAPMPIRNYVSVVKVDESPKGARISWSCSFEAPAEVEGQIHKALVGMYQVALEGLSRSLG